MPPRKSTAAADRGMQVLEQKLNLLAQGASNTRRNPALDVLTGRVPDERLQTLRTNLLATANPGSGNGPTAMVLPVAAIRMAAVARSSRPAPSPWLKASHAEQPRLRLVSPPPSRWTRVPWLGPWLLRLMMERRAYRWAAHSPRAHLVS